MNNNKCSLFVSLWGTSRDGIPERTSKWMSLCGWTIVGSPQGKARFRFLSCFQENTPSRFTELNPEGCHLGGTEQMDYRTLNRTQFTFPLNKELRFYHISESCFCFMEESQPHLKLTSMSTSLCLKPYHLGHFYCHLFTSKPVTRVNKVKLAFFPSNISWMSCWKSKAEPPHILSSARGVWACEEKAPHYKHKLQRESWVLLGKGTDKKPHCGLKLCFRRVLR